MVSSCTQSYALSSQLTAEGSYRIERPCVARPFLLFELFSVPGGRLHVLVQVCFSHEELIVKF